MRVKNLLALATVAVFATSCGESSTNGNATEGFTNDTTMNSDTRRNSDTFSGTTSGKMAIAVPEQVQVSFKQKYPTASNVTWNRYEPVNTFDWEWTGWSRMDTADYVANYRVGADEFWAWYDNENNWIGTVMTVTNHAGLPAAVNKSIQTNFAGYTLVSVDKENDKNRTAYELEMTKDGETMKALIAENGAVLKKKGRVDGEKVKVKNL